MNANETCEDSIHGPYEPDDVADHCGGCGIPLCEEHARKCPCCGRVIGTDKDEIDRTLDMFKDIEEKKV